MTSEPRLHAISIDLSDGPWASRDLLSLLPKTGPTFAWLSNQTQLVAWGEAARLEVWGKERFSRAQIWWQQFVDSLSASPETREQLVAFVSFAFKPEGASSVIAIPEVSVIRHEAQTRLVLVGSEHLIGHGSAVLTEASERDSIPPVTWSASDSQKSEWSRMIEAAVDRIKAGEIDKVVLARGTTGTAERAIDTRSCLVRLQEMNPSSWVFKVDDLVGATPELLISRNGTLVQSRVLAGTIHAGPQDETPEEPTNEGDLARILLGSAKDLTEHEYAVDSVATSLASHCVNLSVPRRPSVLRLGDIAHLATEISGQLIDDAPVLTLAASLHPTAAVCGTPTERAMSLISELERIDRGRYSGPVGWVGANGDGELGIALRCARINEGGVTAYAGCGLVAESEPELEWQESEAKLATIRKVFVS